MHHDPFCSIGSTWSWWSIGVFTDLRSFRLSCENASPTARLAPPSRTSILMLWTGFKRTKRRPRPNRCHERREGKLIGAWQVEAEIPSICAKVRFLVTRMVAGTRKSVRPWRSRLGRVGTNSGDTDVGAQIHNRFGCGECRIISANMPIAQRCLPGPAGCWICITHGCQFKPCCSKHTKRSYSVDRTRIAAYTRAPGTRCLSVALTRNILMRGGAVR